MPELYYIFDICLSCSLQYTYKLIILIQTNNSQPVFSLVLIAVSQALLHHLNQLGEDLLSVSDMHYLQHYLVPSRQINTSDDQLAWASERKDLMNTIDALKDLLKQRDRIVALVSDNSCVEFL